MASSININPTSTSTSTSPSDRIEPIASTSTSELTFNDSTIPSTQDHDDRDINGNGDGNSEEQEEEEDELESGIKPELIISTTPNSSSSGLIQKKVREIEVDIDPEGIIEDHNSAEEEVEGTEEVDDQEGESSDDSESESEDEEEEEEEEEPTLKYSRLGGDTIDILAKDSASALIVSDKYIVLGTHNGAVFVLDFNGKIIKRFSTHSAMINGLSIDYGSDFVASASMDGKISIHSLSLTTPESYAFDLRRPLRCVALEPNFGKRTTHQFVSGGMAGNLILHEKGWLGNKQEVIHSGEGPIGTVEWRGNLIAWANDNGVRIYDTATGQRITYISRAADSPRADLFKCTLRWQDDSTLLIAWADFIKVAKIKSRESRRAQLGVGLPRVGLPTTSSSSSDLFVEVTKIFQVDCMISGIAPQGDDNYLILAYLVEEDVNEATENREEQKRKIGNRPELRIISKEGEELSSDAISLRNYDKFQCRDYSLCPAPRTFTSNSSTKNGSTSKRLLKDERFYVISPEDIVLAKPRDEIDHVAWLIEQKQYEAALLILEKSSSNVGMEAFDITEIGLKYLEYLVDDEQFTKVAEMCPKILGINATLWEDWVFKFADKGHMDLIIPCVPTHDPQLSRLVYEMILSHFLRHDPEALLRTIKVWPHDIYDVAAVILALQDQLDRKPGSKILMESIAELFLQNRQPGKALPYFLKLRRSNVFDLIRDYNLFTDVQDQALLLIEFDQDLKKMKKDEKDALIGGKGGNKVLAEEEEAEEPKFGTAITLLVDHTHSIPIPRVVSQLQSHRQYLYMYLDALFDKDPHLAFDYSDLQVDLYAEYDANKLIDFLRASNYYSLERAYKICDARDLVPEMVFLLGRMGDNKRALNLIIERLGDVQRAIEFAKEQNDHDLWEDLLKYSENKPTFIRGLLENVGAEIDPIRLIRRIKNGLEIPGLKPALIKILQDFNLQISLMEGCKTILYSDCRQLALSLHHGQTSGFLWTAETSCRSTQEPIYPHLNGQILPSTLPFGVHYLCGHTYTGEKAFPNSDLQPSIQRANLIAASLLRVDGSSSDQMNSEMEVKAKEMTSRIRMTLELRGGNEGCGECRKGVKLT